MLYLIVKHAHITFVTLTIILFNLRFWLRFARPQRPLATLLKIVPHINDTLLLFTGLWLMNITGWVPFGNANWLGVKLVLLVVYIILGAITMRAVPRSPRFMLGYVLAMAAVSGMVYLAYYKPLLW